MNMSLNEQMNFHYYHKMTAKKEKKGEGPPNRKRKKGKHESWILLFKYTPLHIIHSN